MNGRSLLSLLTVIFVVLALGSLMAFPIAKMSWAFGSVLVVVMPLMFSGHGFVALAMAANNPCALQVAEWMVALV